MSGNRVLPRVSSDSHYARLRTDGCATGLSWSLPHSHCPLRAMENAAIFGWTLLWILFWGALGGVVTPRIYARKDLEISQASFGGAAIGAALGPLSLAPLWIATPKITNRLIAIGLALVVGLFVAAFALADPDNLCVVNGGFVVSQLANGIVIGINLRSYGPGPDPDILHPRRRQLRPRRVLHDRRHGYLLYDLTLASRCLPFRRHSGQLRHHIRHRSSLSNASSSVPWAADR